MATTVSAVPLPIETIRPSSLNARRRLDPVAMKELTDSVRAHGVLQPLLVRPIDGGKKFEVVFGHRRLAAAKAAKLEDVPCTVRPLTDQEALEIGLIENLQREDVHPLDEADGYRKLMKEAGYDVPAIAAKVNKSVSYIYQRLKLAGLVPEAAEAFGADKITAGHAIQIARLEPKYQKETLAECFKQEWQGPGQARQKVLVSVRALGSWIAENVHLDLAAAPWKKDDATLHPPAGPCTTCPKRTGFMPDLFPDIAKKDTCTDRACFGQKLGAHLARAREGLKAKGAPFVEVSREYTGRRDPKGPLDPQRWREAGGKGCAHAQAGLVVGGKGLGQVVKVCTEPSCKVHGMGRHPSVGLSPREQARRKQELRRYRTEGAFKTKLLDAIVAKVPATLGRPELELVALHAVNRLWHEHSKRICQRHGWEPKKAQYGGKSYDDAAAERIRKWSPGELGRFLVEVALISTIDANAPGFGGDAKRLLEAAKRYRIDVNAVRREATVKPKKAAAGKGK